MLKQKLRTRFWITWNGSSELFPVLFRFPFMISPNPVWRCLFNEFAQTESQRQWRYGSVCSRKAALYYFSIFPYGKNSKACLYCQQCSSYPYAIYLCSVSFGQIMIVQIYLAPCSSFVCANFGGKKVQIGWIASLDQIFVFKTTAPTTLCLLKNAKDVSWSRKMHLINV